MARVALDALQLGDHGIIEAGQDIPETWNVGGGEEFKTDFARLEELGLVAAKGKKAAPADEPVEDAPAEDGVIAE